MTERLKTVGVRLEVDMLNYVERISKLLHLDKSATIRMLLKEGVELTLKGLRDTLIKAGLEEVKAQGESFDPNYHHAVSELEHEEIESGMILEQFQKGYTFNQRLIRPAMVVVSKGKPIESSNHGESPEGEG